MDVSKTKHRDFQQQERGAEPTRTCGTWAALGSSRVEPKRGMSPLVSPLFHENDDELVNRGEIRWLFRFSDELYISGTMGYMSAGGKLICIASDAMICLCGHDVNVAYLPKSASQSNMA